MKKLTEIQKAIRVVDATMRIMGGPGSAQEDAWQKVRRAAETSEGPQPAPNSRFTSAQEIYTDYLQSGTNQDFRSWCGQQIRVPLNAKRC